MGDRDRLAQALDEDFRAHAAIEPGHQPAAIERGHRADKGENGQRDHQREHARQDQHLDRIEAHGAQRVYLLAHFHGAELGRIGAARAARAHDGDQEHADLAQYQDADQVDHIGVGAELAEVEYALLGDDAADQKGDQRHDRHRLPAHTVEMMHRRGQAEAARLHRHAHERDAQGGEHFQKDDQVGPELGRPVADEFEKFHQPVCRGRLRRRHAVDLMHLVEQFAKALGRGNEAGLLATLDPAGQALEQPRPQRVELAHAGNVDGQTARDGGLRRGRVHQPLQGIGVGGGPGAGRLEFDALAADRRAQRRLGCRRCCHCLVLPLSIATIVIRAGVTLTWRKACKPLTQKRNRRHDGPLIRL